MVLCGVALVHPYSFFWWWSLLGTMADMSMRPGECFFYELAGAFETYTLVVK